LKETESFRLRTMRDYHGHLVLLTFKIRNLIDYY